MKRIFTFIAVILGVAVMTGAMNKALEGKESIKQEPFKYWYSVSYSESDLPQVTGAPIAEPPQSDPNGCAQDNPSSDNLCAIELVVPSENYSFSGDTALDNLPAGVSLSGKEARSPEL